MTGADRYLYLHIPKTGGVAFRQILENAVGASEILHFRTPRAIAEHTDSTLSPYRLVHGHFNGAHIQHLRSFRTVVTLRGPVARCRSTYSFWKGLNPNDPTWAERSKQQIRRAQSLTLADMLDHPDPVTRAHFRNVQTRVLAGEPDPRVELTEAHLQAAMERLFAFDFIAVNEELEYCKMLMCWKFSIFYPRTPVRLNASKQKVQLSEELRVRLTEANRLDAKLLAAVNSVGLQQINRVAPFTCVAQGNAVVAETILPQRKESSA